jgi:hypothetical protein
MNRQELIELRDHLQHHVEGLTEILRKVEIELESPAPVGMEPYDELEDILLQSEPHDEEDAED